MAALSAEKGILGAAYWYRGSCTTTCFAASVMKVVQTAWEGWCARVATKTQTQRLSSLSSFITSPSPEGTWQYFSPFPFPFPPSLFLSSCFFCFVFLPENQSEERGRVKRESARKAGINIKPCTFASCACRLCPYPISSRHPTSPKSTHLLAIHLIRTAKCHHFPQITHWLHWDDVVGDGVALAYWEQYHKGALTVFPAWDYSFCSEGTTTWRDSQAYLLHCCCTLQCTCVIFPSPLLPSLHFKLFSI